VASGCTALPASTAKTTRGSAASEAPIVAFRAAADAASNSRFADMTSSDDDDDAIVVFGASRGIIGQAISRSVSEGPSSAWVGRPNAAPGHEREQSPACQRLASMRYSERKYRD